MFSIYLGWYLCVIHDEKGKQVMDIETTKRNVAYLKTFSEARSIAEKVGGRVVQYRRGFAVQYRKSDRYYPELEGSTENK
jgi:hypothetical protein